MAVLASRGHLDAALAVPHAFLDAARRVPPATVRP